MKTGSKICFCTGCPWVYRQMKKVKYIVSLLFQSIGLDTARQVRSTSRMFCAPVSLRIGPRPRIWLRSCSMFQSLRLSFAGVQQGARTPVTFLLLTAIWFYQTFLSQWKGFQCAHHHVHHEGSCSHFAVRAAQQFGFTGMRERLKMRLHECSRAASLLSKQTPGAGRTPKRAGVCKIFVFPHYGAWWLTKDKCNWGPCGFD